MLFPGLWNGEKRLLGGIPVVSNAAWRAPGKGGCTYASAHPALFLEHSHCLGANQQQTRPGNPHHIHTPPPFFYIFKVLGKCKKMMESGVEQGDVPQGE